MMNATAIPLDDYANSMFRYERLHDGWIDRCAAYLKHIFGESLQGASVVDYAFGRGNWSVAFIRAGAKEVHAVDASLSNVRRFGGYCAAEGLKNIHVHHGNVLEKPFPFTADILWLYGILPAITDQAGFLRAVMPLAPGDKAQVLAYGYDRFSLRELVVEKARAHALFASEDAFRRESLKFTPAARMRARDDLTAPHVEWHTAQGLASLFAPHGMKPVAQFADFRAFDSFYRDEEFSPHHLLLARNGNAIAPREPSRPFAKDRELLGLLWDAAERTLPAPSLRDLAISAFNTHFSHLSADGAAWDCVREHALLLLYALKNANVNDLPPVSSSLLTLAEASLSDAPRQPLPEYAKSRIVQHLAERTIRL